MSQVGEVLHPTQRTMGCFGNESFEAINYTRIDSWKQRNWNKHMHVKHRKEQTKNLPNTSIKLQKPGLDAFYDIRLENRVSL